MTRTNPLTTRPLPLSNRTPGHLYNTFKERDRWLTGVGLLLLALLIPSTIAAWFDPRLFEYRHPCHALPATGRITAGSTE